MFAKHSFPVRRPIIPLKSKNALSIYFLSWLTLPGYKEFTSSRLAYALYLFAKQLPRTQVDKKGVDEWLHFIRMSFWSGAICMVVRQPELNSHEFLSERARFVRSSTGTYAVFYPRIIWELLEILGIHGVSLTRNSESICGNSAQVDYSGCVDPVKVPCPWDPRVLQKHHVDELWAVFFSNGFCSRAEWWSVCWSWWTSAIRSFCPWRRSARIRRFRSRYSCWTRLSSRWLCMEFSRSSRFSSLRTWFLKWVHFIFPNSFVFPFSIHFPGKDHRIITLKIVSKVWLV